MYPNRSPSPSKIIAFFLPSLAMIFVICVPPVFGKQITLNITSTSSSQSGQLAISVSISNSGDETARRVHLELQLPFQTIAGEKKISIPPGGKAQFRFETTVPEVKPGTYPFVLRTHFFDTRLFPFSTLQVGTFIHESAANSFLHISSEQLTMERSAVLKLTAVNSSNQDATYRADCILPEEFSTDEPQKSVFIPAHSKRHLYFPLHNKSAMPNSVYPAFCVFQTEDQPLHATAIARTGVTVKAQPGENFFYTTRWSWLLAYFIFCLAILAIRLLTRKIQSTGSDCR